MKVKKGEFNMDMTPEQAIRKAKEILRGKEVVKGSSVKAEAFLCGSYHHYDGDSQDDRDCSRLGYGEEFTIKFEQSNAVGITLYGDTFQECLDLLDEVVNK